MRYELGNADKYSTAVNGTVMENASFFKATLDDVVDRDRLLASVRTALPYHPLFQCRLAYDREYYLEDNEGAEIVIFHADTESRPKEFGKNTNGFLFQLCYFENTISLEWCHAVTDGRGAIRFFSTVLDAYFGLEMPEIPAEFPLAPAYESICDKSVRPIGQIKQPPGFRASAMKVVRNGYRCTSHVLKVSADEVMRVARKTDATPAAIIVPLFCRAIREHLPKEIKNRNVSCGVVVDCRAPMQMDTMHNFFYDKVITYQDRFDAYDLPQLSTVYRGILDLFVQPENVIWACTEIKSSTDPLYNMRPRWLQRAVTKIVGRIVKRMMNNIGFTYIGRVPFSEEVKKHLKDFNFRSWPDIGDCVVAAVDLNGTLALDICENYADKGVVDSFIRICRAHGMNVEEAQTTVFEQANVRL